MHIIRVLVCMYRYITCILMNERCQCLESFARKTRLQFNHAHSNCFLHVTNTLSYLLIYLEFFLEQSNCSRNIFSINVYLFQLIAIKNALFLGRLLGYGIEQYIQCCNIEHRPHRSSALWSAVLLISLHKPSRHKPCSFSKQNKMTTMIDRPIEKLSTYG